MTSAGSDRDAVLVAYARTPFGRATKGSLVDSRPEDLAVAALRGAFAAVDGLEPADVEDLILGSAEQHGEQGQNVARRVAVMLGEDGLPGVSVNRLCASSLQAARMAFHAIRAGEGDAFAVGGVDCVSRVKNDVPPHPMFDDAARRAKIVFDDHEDWTDPRLAGQLPDIHLAMGATAEFVARLTGTSRAAQDEFAAESQRRAAQAQQSGYFRGEIVPITTAGGAVVTEDDGIRPSTTVSILAGLPPAFRQGGTVTAGNSSPLNDGASAAILMSAGRARAIGLTPSVRIIATAVSGISPEIMGLGPVEASRIALERAGLGISDIDAVELNEAFAAQALPSALRIGADLTRVNPHGGAIALGHPYGATGVRMLGTLSRELHELDGTFGLATLCVGGGQGFAMVIERI